MEGPITAAAGTPAMAELLRQLNALMPEGTALFVVAVGPLGENMLREVAMGGPLGDADGLPIASQALAARGRPGFGVALKSRMH